MRPAVAAVLLVPLLGVGLTACEEIGEPEEVPAVEEEAGFEPLHQEEYEPFEGEFTVDTARWQGAP